MGELRDDTNDLDIFRVRNLVCGPGSVYTAVEIAVALCLGFCMNRETHEARPSARFIVEFTRFGHTAVFAATEALCKGPRAIFIKETGGAIAGQAYRSNTYTLRPQAELSARRQATATRAPRQANSSLPPGGEKPTARRIVGVRQAATKEERNQLGKEERNRSAAETPAAPVDASRKALEGIEEYRLYANSLPPEDREWFYGHILLVARTAEGVPPADVVDEIKAAVRAERYARLPLATREALDRMAADDEADPSCLRLSRKTSHSALNDLPPEKRAEELAKLKAYADSFLAPEDLETYCLQDDGTIYPRSICVATDDDGLPTEDEYEFMAFLDAQHEEQQHRQRQMDIQLDAFNEMVAEANEPEQTVTP